jgi:membrane protease subunit (stomatin/prohibitin family)
VYFVSTRQFTDQKWGTRNPIMTRDPEFGPVRLRAFGSFAYRVSEPAKFVCEIVGTNGHFQSDDIGGQLRNLIVARFTDAVGEGKVPVLDLAGNLNELGAQVTGQIGPEFAEYGIEITKLLVENVSLPEEVEKALDKRSSMGVLGNMGTYTQFQAANAIEAAAKNPGGDASAGMGLGMGFAMANQMAQAMNPNAAGAARPAAGPPPLPQAAQFYVAINGQQSGPHGLDVLRQHVGAGALTPDTLVWRDGMATWTRAGEVSELGSLFPAGPPPLPS